MSNILNIAKHDCDGATTLSWMLWQWQMNPHEPLLIITRDGDGANLNNRIRVRLSDVRAMLKRADDKRYQRFGLKTTIIEWHVDDVYYEALCIERVINVRHVMSEALAASGLTFSKPTK